MASRRGRCTNFDYCSVAESRRDVPVRVGADFVCPECGKTLKAPPAKGRRASPAVAILLGVGVLVLAGGSMLLGMRMGALGWGAPIWVGQVLSRQGWGGQGWVGQGSGGQGRVGQGSGGQGSVGPWWGAGRASGSAPGSAPGSARGSAARAADSPMENVLARVHGAPAMAGQIVAPLAAAYLGEIGDTGVTTTTIGAVTQVSGMRGAVRESIVIDGDGPGAGFAALGTGRADLVMAPRRILAAEQAGLAALGDMTQPDAEHALALAVQAVVVNSANRVASLTRVQISDLLADKVTDWGSLGGPPGAVDVYTVRPQTGRQGMAGVAGAALAAPGQTVPNAAPGTRLVGDDAAVSRAMVADLHGVGVVDLGAIGEARAVPVAEAGAPPVSPADHAAVAAGRYALTDRLYLYGSPKVAPGFAARFLAYALGPQGQEVVEAHGLVSPMLRAAVAAGLAGQAGAAAPRSVEGSVQAVGVAASGGAGAAQAGGPAGETGRLRAYVAGARKLGIVFHFQPSSTALDQFGERDLDRVTNYLASTHEGGAHLLLAGFADNQGDAASNVEVSRKRAESVAALFATRGLKPGGVEGFGAALPVGDNGSEVGRERNRRVEVYIQR